MFADFAIFALLPACEPPKPDNPTTEIQQCLIVAVLKFPVESLGIERLCAWQTEYACLQHYEKGEMRVERQRYPRPCDEQPMKAVVYQTRRTRPCPSLRNGRWFSLWINSRIASLNAARQKNWRFHNAASTQR
jgi:hypothetical protein